MAKTDIRNYNGKRFRTLTVAELIERLEGEDPNALVVFSTNYGDYHRTQQALPIEGHIEEVAITKSAYSNSGFALLENDEEAEDPGTESGDEEQTILVIR